MAQYFTDKYLKYWAALKRGPIRADHPCEACSYNLRGLRFGSVCPECGAPIRYRRHRDLAFHEMPLDLIRTFRASAWMASLSLGGIMVLLLGGARLVGSTAISMTLLTALGVLWLVAVWRLTPALAQPPGEGRVFAARSRLRLAARWLQLAWVVHAAPGMAVAWSGTGGLSNAMRAISALAYLLGVAGILCLALLLARLAAWARDEFAEKAFYTCVFGSTIGFAILLMIPVMALAFGTLFLLVLAVGLSIVVMSLLAFPVGLLALSRTVDWSLVHAHERVDRGRELAARMVRRGPRESVEDDGGPIPLADDAGRDRPDPQSGPEAGP